MDDAPVSLRMPYPRWRRWSRSLRRRSSAIRAAASGGDANDRVYLGYGLVLVGLAYLPMLWSGLAGAAAGLPAERGALLVAVVALTGLATLLGPVVARAGGPLWVTPAEATFELGGQFAPQAVLWRRALLLVVVMGAVGAFGGTALAAGASGLLDGSAPPGTTATALVWGLVVAMVGQVPLALGVAAQCPRRRRPAWTTAASLAVVGLVVAGAWAGTSASAAASAPAFLAAPGAAVVVVGAVLAASSVVLVVRLLPDAVDVDETAAALLRTRSAGFGTVGGDVAGLRNVFGPQRAPSRRGTFWPVLLRHAPVAARDVLGLVRRPGAVLGSVAVGIVGAVLVILGVADAVGPVGAVGTAGPGPTGLKVWAPSMAATAGAALLYAASSTWADGLREMAGQPTPGGLLPGRLARVVGAHLVVPVALAILVGAVGTAVAALSGRAAAGGSAVALGVALVVVVTARTWMAGATTVPVALFMPTMTPNGDASSLIVGAWYLRGWTVVLGAAWLLGIAGPGAAPVLLVLAALLVVLAVRRIERA